MHKIYIAKQVFLRNASRGLPWNMNTTSYNKKRRKFKTILIWRSSRKMNRNKNLLILYYLWENFEVLYPSFAMHRKKFAMPFLFKFVPQQIINLLFMFNNFVKLIASKSRQMSLVSKSIYSRWESLCFIYFTSSFNSKWKKSSSWWKLFFSRANEIKWNENMWPCATTDNRHAQRFYLTVARRLSGCRFM